MDGAALAERFPRLAVPVNQQEHNTLLGMIHAVTLKADEAMIHSAQTADNAVAAHKRLGDRILDLGERIQGVEECQALLREKQARLEEQFKGQRDTPPDLARSVIPTKFWVTMAVICGAVMGMTYSVKSDVRDLSTQQAAQVRLIDERSTNQKLSDERKDKEIAMIRVQLESLTKMVISQQRR